MAQQIKDSDVGIMQEKQPGRRDWGGPIRELLGTAKIGKLSHEAANYTIAWLRNQTDYQHKTRVYKNALFGYDPTNERFKNMVLDFWNEYSKEVGSWRDQPYWAYFLKKHNMTPLPFPTTTYPEMGSGGKKGFNGHIYVKSKSQAKESWSL
jgi:hypothetical protein